MRWDGQTTLRSPRIQVTMRWDGQTTLTKSRIQVTMMVGRANPVLQVSYSSDYEVGWANHT